MAKALTPAEREERRQASSDRRKGWRARYNARREAEKAGMVKIEARIQPLVEPLERQSDRLDDERKRLDAERLAAVMAVETEYAKNKADLAARVAANREARQKVYAQSRDARQALEAALDNEFPDLTGAAQWSAASWVPPKNKR